VCFVAPLSAPLKQKAVAKEKSSDSMKCTGAGMEGLPCGHVLAPSTAFASVDKAMLGSGTRIWVRGFGFGASKYV